MEGRFPCVICIERWSFPFANCCILGANIDLGSLYGLGNKHLVVILRRVVRRRISL
jgi:hypothetical protein